MLYPQNGDRIVTIDSVTSIHPMYKIENTGGTWTNTNSYRENEALSNTFTCNILRHNCFMPTFKSWTVHRIIEYLTLELLSSLWNIHHSTTVYFFDPPCIYRAYGLANGSTSSHPEIWNSVSWKCTLSFFCSRSKYRLGALTSEGRGETTGGKGRGQPLPQIFWPRTAPSRVVSVLDSGAVGLGSNRSRDAVG